MSHVTRDHLSQSLIDELGMSSSCARKVVDVMLNSLAKSLAEGKNVELRRFGAFTIKKTKERPGRNPMKPSEAVVIPARLSIKFKPGRFIKEALAERPLN